MIVERQPIIVTPAPIMAAPAFMGPPMGGGWGPPQDPSVNFNFSFPR